MRKVATVFEKKQLFARFDPKLVSAARLRRAIEKLGFKAKRGKSAPWPKKK